MRKNGLSRSIQTICLMVLLGSGLFGISCSVPGSSTPVPTIIPADQTSPQDQQIELSGLESREFTFEYDCEEKSIQLDMYRSLFNFYKSKNKSVYYDPKSPDDWRTKTNLQFLNSSHDDEVITDLIEGIRSELKEPNLDEVALAAVSLVQRLEYDCEKYYSYETDDGQDYEINYPYETLFLKEGVCGDSSLLLGKILMKLGFGASLISYSDANHMAVGIKCPSELANYHKEGVGYCFIETTAPSRIGMISDLVGSVVMNESDLLIKISDGKTFNLINQLVQSREQDVEMYGDFILELATCDEISAYIYLVEQEAVVEGYEERLDALELEIEPIHKRIEENYLKFEDLGCSGKLSSSLYKICSGIVSNIKNQRELSAPLEEEYQALYSEYEEIFEKYDESIGAFDNLLEENHQGCDELPSDDPSMDE